MFCPSCGAQNDSNQGYCRQCGQGLAYVAVAMNGRLQESDEKLSASNKWVTQGTATVFVFAVLGLVMTGLAIVFSDPSLLGIALVNVLAGCLIGLPVLLVGRARQKQAIQLLSKIPAKTELSRQNPDNTLQTGGLTTGALAAKLEVPALPSVTEQTTLSLKHPPRADI